MPVTLKAAYQNLFPIGAAIAPEWAYRPEFDSLITREYSSLTAENIMKPMMILDHDATVAAGDPVNTVQNFAETDKMLTWARERGIRMRYHVLVWHGQTPWWFFKENWSDDKDAPDASPELVLKRMEAWIRDVMTHVNTCFPGVVYCWDVVNEAIEPEHGAPGLYRTKSPWYHILGEEFVPAAFRAARKYQAPDQQLYYNDFNSFQPDKHEAIIALLKKLQAENLVDGMGMQGHLQMEWPAIADFEKAARAYAALGLSLQVTELDIHCPTALENGQTLLAERYGELFGALVRMKRDGIDLRSVTFWGVTDRTSWLTGFRKEGSSPMLFDDTFAPKAAYDAVINAAK